MVLQNMGTTSKTEPWIDITVEAQTFIDKAKREPLHINATIGLECKHLASLNSEFRNGSPL